MLKCVIEERRIKFSMPYDPGRRIRLTKQDILGPNLSYIIPTDSPNQCPMLIKEA